VIHQKSWELNHRESKTRKL